MDGLLDTLSDELCLENAYVDCIARRQAVMGGFTASPSPSPQASEDKGNDDSSGDDEDEGASSSGDEEMTASQ